MLLKKEREQVVLYGKKLVESGLTVGTGGNISIADREKGLFCINPSGIGYYETTPEDVVVMDFDGNVVDGERKPSSEYHMHLLVYRNFEDAGAAVHCHSIYATVMATNRMDLPASNYMVAMAGGKYIKCSEYATFGSPEIAEKSIEALGDRKACLQANHGQLTYGRTIGEAFNLAETVEHLCRIHLLSLVSGNPVILDEREMDSAIERFRTYGQ